MTNEKMRSEQEIKLVDYNRGITLVHCFQIFDIQSSSERTKERKRDRQSDRKRNIKRDRIEK